MKRNTLLASSLFFTLCNPALALDFHPLESQELAGGIYSFDNFIIPAGVTVALVGEAKSFTVNATQDIVIDGTLAYEGDWTFTLNAGGNISWGSSGQVTPGEPGSETAPVRPPVPRLDVFTGTLLSVQGGGDIALLNTTFIPGTGLIPSAAGNISLRAVVPAASLQTGRLTLLNWSPFSINNPGSIAFEQSPAVLDRLLAGRLKSNGFVEVISGQISLLNKNGIQVADARVLDTGAIVPSGGMLLLENGSLTPAVPEPETWAMLLAGLGLLGWRARRGNP